MINVISHIIHYRTNVANAKIKRFWNLLFQSKERAKITKNWFRFLKLKISNCWTFLKLNELKSKLNLMTRWWKIARRRRQWKKKNEKKKKWKKFKNNKSVVTTMKNEFAMTFFLNRLMMTIARKQRVKHFFKKNR